jgi:hypothetical protein
MIGISEDTATALEHPFRSLQEAKRHTALSPFGVIEPYTEAVEKRFIQLVYSTSIHLPRYFVKREKWRLWENLATPKESGVTFMFLKSTSEMFDNPVFKISSTWPDLSVWSCEPIVETRWSSSTAQWERPEEVIEELEFLFMCAKEEAFEDGMESEFSHQLVASIMKYGESAVEALHDYILGADVNSEAASEALRWIGQIEDPATRRQRRRLLERSLKSPHARVRDGAVLGLSFLNDPNAAPYLEHAVKRERIDELRQDMEQVLAQLQATLIQDVP